jgi:hypothetical protein
MPVVNSPRSPLAPTSGRSRAITRAGPLCGTAIRGPSLQYVLKPSVTHPSSACGSAAARSSGPGDQEYGSEPAHVRRTPCFDDRPAKVSELLPAPASITALGAAGRLKFQDEGGAANDTGLIEARLLLSAEGGEALEEGGCVSGRSGAVVGPARVVSCAHPCDERHAADRREGRVAGHLPPSSRFLSRFQSFGTNTSQSPPPIQSFC